MKKLLFTLFAAAVLTACGTTYNNQLKQVELGMSKQQIVNLMGDKYTQSNTGGTDEIEYVDRYKNHWYFQFDNNGQLVKWYKETER